MSTAQTAAVVIGLWLFGSVAVGVLAGRILRGPRR